MDSITITGVIRFEPEDKTKKHKNQSSWKKIAMVFFDGDICDYYSWFVFKRFKIILNKPLRGPHISFINDSVMDLTNNGEISQEAALFKWEEIKTKWEGKKIDITLDLNLRTNGPHWWLNIPHDKREELQEIRNELGLGKPYFGLHMSIGYARPGIMECHSEYIHESIKKGFIK